ncbi:MAG: diguanylate cyclase [Gammaproteobacteria bacterium]|nr:diguanylate cyclase [Gammaproteobacteria bacterium]
MKNSRTSSARIGLDLSRSANDASSQTLPLGQMLGRCWLVTHLASLAGIGACLWQRVPLPLLTGWSAFVLLNVLLREVLLAPPAQAAVAADHRHLATALSAVLGLAWGLGIALLLPYADTAGVAALLSGALAVALVAIPVLSEQTGAYGYFLATAGLLTVGGFIHDAARNTLTLWVALALATLALLGSVYAHTQQALRELLRRLHSALHGHGLSVDSARGSLFEHAMRGVDALHEVLAREARQAQMLETLGDALITTDGSGNVHYANGAAAALLGVDAQQLDERPLEDCLRLVYGREPHNRTRDIFEQVRQHRRPQSLHDQAQLLRHDGVAVSVDYLFTPLCDADGEFDGVSVQLRDVTARRQRTESIAWRASHDALTGTINRSEFERRMHKLLSRTGDSKPNSHTLLYIDIDKFKFINDTYGHAAGDHALRTLTDVLRTRIRGADTLARIGGDEFCALLYSCDANRARLIGESLRSAIEQHDFTWQAIQLPVSISVGLVEITADMRDTAALLRAADAACYSAKNFGRNRVQMFEAVNGEEAQQERRLTQVREIQNALGSGRLDLFYQPLCATTASLPIDRCEVAVGIRTASDDYIPRHDVTEVAARYQLSADIDRWLINASLEALRSDHPVLSDMRVLLIPLSAQSVGDDRLLEYAIRSVREHGEVANRIGFSLPEAGIAQHLEFVRYFITTLKQDGCQFMISDLGFAGGAIDAIKSMQLDYLGIRGSFVRNLLASSADYEVVLGLCRVAQALGMQTVAEHADSRSLRDALAKMGVDYAKGLLHDGPRRVARFDESLLARRGERLV